MNFGGDEETPIMEHQDGNDGDDAGDTTTPFTPGEASTPAHSSESHRMITMSGGNRESGGTAKTSFIRLPETPGLST